MGRAVSRDRPEGRGSPVVRVESRGERFVARWSAERRKGSCGRRY